MASIQKIQNAVSSWAQTKPEISKAWLFGSRAKGTNGTNSDVDIALRVLGDLGNTPSGIFCFEKQSWKNELETILKLEIDLWPENKNLSPNRVYPAVQDHGILLYEREI